MIWDVLSVSKMNNILPNIKAVIVFSEWIKPEALNWQYQECKHPTCDLNAIKYALCYAIDPDLA